MIALKKVPKSRRLTKGASAVELAIIAPVLGLLICAIFELSILFWVNLTMQHAVREGARYSVTGQNDRDKNPNANARKRYRGIVDTIIDSSITVYEKMDPKPRISIKKFSTGSSGTFATYNSPNDYNDDMFGGPGEMMVIQLDCSWPLILFRKFVEGGKYQFSVAATMQNEAF